MCSILPEAYLAKVNVSWTLVSVIYFCLLVNVDIEKTLFSDMFLMFWLKGELNQISFLCLLRFCLDDVLVRMYFTEMLNSLSVKADSYGLLLTLIYLHCRMSQKFICLSCLVIWGGVWFWFNIQRVAIYVIAG